MAPASFNPFLHYLHKIVVERWGGELSDAQLLERFAVFRDEAAFEVLVWRHAPMVLTVCQRLLRSPQDVEDAFQAVFLTLVRKAHSIRKGTALGAWFHRVAYRVALRAKAAAARRAVAEKQVEEFPEVASPDDTVGQGLRTLLDEAIERLPEKYRAPVVLCYLQGKSNQEAAVELGWPLGTVFSRLARARELLRVRLARGGLALPAAALTAVFSQSATAAVPADWVRTAVRVAVLSAAGKATGVVSAPALALAEGMARAMAAPKLKIAAAVLLAVTALGLGAGVVLGPRPSASAPPPADGEQAAAKEMTRPEADDRKPKADLFGDPLPAGAVARMGTVRWRHLGAYCLAISPDGTMVATGPVNPGFIRLWDITTGREIRRFKGRASTISFSSDGRSLFSFGDREGTSEKLEVAKFEVRCWDVASGKPLHSFEVKDSSVMFHLGINAVIFKSSRDDHDYEERKVWALDASTDVPIDLPDVLSRSRNVAFSADGRLAASIAKDYSIRIHDRARGTVRHQLGELPGAFPLVISPDGKRLAAAVRSGKAPVIQVWDTTSGKLISRWEGHDAGVHHLALSPDGKRLASTAYDRTMRLWDVVTGKERWLLRTPGSSVWSHPAFSPDGKTLVVLGSDGVVRLLDPASGKEIQQYHEHNEHGRLAITPDGKRLITGGAWYGSLRVWDMATGKEVCRLKGPDVSTYSKEKQEILPFSNTISALACSPDGKTLIVGCRDGIELWDLTTFQGPRYLHKNDKKAYVRSCMLSPDGKMLAGWHIDMHLWDMTTGQKLRVIPPPDGRAFTSAAFSPNGRVLATGDSDRVVRLWDVSRPAGSTSG